MKTLTLNGDWAIATAAFAQFYDSFAWDNDTALTAFDFGIEQTLFESLEAEFGAHLFISSNQVIWSDGTETITLSTDATLSADDTQRSAQITNLSAQNDTLELTYSSAGQADVDLIWTPTSLKLISGGQTAESVSEPSPKGLRKISYTPSTRHGITVNSFGGPAFTRRCHDVDQ